MGTISQGFLDGLALPPDYTISQWADLHVMLSQESSAEPGRWRTDRAPYQRAMMDSITDPDVKTVVLHTSAQIGKTSVLLNGIGYHIHHSPAPMMMIQPTLDMAAAFSKDKLGPMLRDTPALAERISPEKSRSASNNMYYKAFPGGTLTIAGANSPTSLRMRSIKIIWADEIDAYPPSAGNEGDPLMLAHKRTVTFYDSKLVCSSTPTVKGISRVEKMFLDSDMRYFYIPCPDCGEFQRLVWEQVVWDKGDPTSAGYCCPHCGTVWNDHDIKRQNRYGEWRATAPFNGVAGFHIWQAYSPWSSLEQIVSEYEKAEKQPNELQVWWNTTLGEVWDGDETAGVTADELYNRREPYPDNIVPERAVVLTAGVDVQGDRIEVLVKAYGANNESWCLAHLKLYGDPATNTPWQELEEVLSVQLAHPAGRLLSIEAAAIDSGFLTQKVYDFSARNFRLGRRWFAIKGVHGEGRTAWEQSKIRLKNGIKLYLVGVDTMKQAIYNRLGNREPGADYIHFPEREPFNRDWFDQLTVERIRTVYDTKGFPKREWYKPEGQRNEAIDINVYADAAHQSLNINHLDRLASLYRDDDSASNVTEVAKLFTGG